MLLETIEQPKMLDIYVQQAWHNVFCYACAYEETEGKRNNDKKLLLAIVSGADSAIQSVRAVVDIGTDGGVRFGYGIKKETDYQFVKESTLFTEKGRYEKFPMSLTSSRKGLVIVHEDVLSGGKYFLSFEDDPAQDISSLLGGAPFGLRIEPEWSNAIYDELIKQGLIEKKEFYLDEKLFNSDGNGLHMFEVKMTEEDADQFISSLLKEGKIKFLKDGTGEKLKEVEDLGRYALEYNESLVAKLSKEVAPLHDAATMKTLNKFDSYEKPLFPVQAHTSTAIAKHLQKNKAVILQGEMSTGKSRMMTAIADGAFNQETIESAIKKKGYHVCLMCPPSLLDKWPKEIHAIIPNADVHVIRKTEQLIKYHNDWTAKGRPKPTKPVFFVISFTTMRNGARIEPAVTYTVKRTSEQMKSNTEEEFYKQGFYCQGCGLPHKAVEDTEKYLDDEGVEYEKDITHNMIPSEFGSNRRVRKSRYDQNAFCYHCGETLWTNKVPTRYNGFKDWAAYEKELTQAVNSGDKIKLASLKASQPNPSGKRGLIRKVATIEYIRRRMKNFFDISLIDEVHMCKAGNTATGNALGSLAAVSKKVVGATGTLFGGLAQDIYYLLWRMFPADMARSGYKYEEVTRFNQEFGNIEKRSFVPYDSNENSNKNSRGGVSRYPDKLLPGISPFIFGKYMMHNVVNVRLKDVWPDPVDLIDTPTIFVPLSDELKANYNSMISEFERHINSADNPGPLYRVMMDYGIAMPDNPFTIPDATIKLPEGDKATLWNATHLDENITLPKEKKPQEINTTEMS